MNKDEALEKLHDIVELKARPAHDPRISATGTKLYVRPSTHAPTLEVTREAVDGLMKLTGLTPNLARKISPTTFASVATEALTGCELLLRDDQVVDFSPMGHQHYIDPRRVFDTLEKAIPKADFHRILTLPDHTIRIETIGAEEKTVTRGDLMKAGALIQFSPVGIENPMVQAFVLRLVCTNGLTTNDILRQFTFQRGSDGNIWPWLRRSTIAAYRALDSIVDRFKNMQKERIPATERATMLAMMLRGAHITGRAAEAIQAEALAHPPETTYDIVNLMGWASSHVVRDAKVIVSTQESIARFAAETRHRELCPACHRIL